MRLSGIIKRVVAFAAVVALIVFGITYSRVQKTEDKTGLIPLVAGTQVSDPVSVSAAGGQLNDVPLIKTLNSKAGIVINADTGKIIYAENAFEVMPIASITKLMSSVVALDHNIALDEVVTISSEDYTIGGNLRIVPGSETVTARDLFYASVTGSANNAALTIAKLSKLSETEFVSSMNRKAIELGLETLRFQEASGLSPKNTGTAYDVARMAGHAFSKYPLILDAASQKEYKITTKNTRREHTIKNPNELFETAAGQFLASKTGYLDEALYCLVLAKKTPGGMIVAVTLGNENKRDGENEALELLKKGETALWTK